MVRQDTAESFRAKRNQLLLRAVVILTLAAGGATLAAESGAKLYLNGKVASADVRTIGSSAYVKVSDMATALGLRVMKRSDGSYELGTAGGANQVEGMRGKLGDTLFTGKWRVTALSVEMPDSYTMKSGYDPRDIIDVNYEYAAHIAHAKPNKKLVLVHLRVSNGQKSPQTLWIAPHDSHTALTDTQGESYPAALDIEGAPIQTKSLLPGSKIEIPILFTVPQEAQIQDLLFTANNNDGGKGQKGNDVRITLQAK